MIRRALPAIVKATVFLAIVAFLIVAVYRNAADLREMEFSFSPLSFTVSTLLILVLFLIQSTGWHRILSGIAHRVGVVEAMAVWFASQVSKYVPGKVMLPLVRFSLCKRCGIDIGRTTMSIYLELALMTGGAIFVFLLSSLGWADNAAWALLAEKLHWAQGAEYLRWVVLLVVPGCLVAVHPKLLERVINFALKLIGKTPLRIEITYGRMMALFAWYVLGWCVYSLSSWLLMVSLTDMDSAQFLPIAGAFTFSWVVGFLSFITPSGLGVREALLTGMLTLWGFPLGTAMVAAVLARLQWTGMELLGALLTIRRRPLPVNGKSP